MKDSPSELMTFSIEVEPSVETVPEMAVSVPLFASLFALSAVSFLLPQAVRMLRASAAVSAREMSFFILKDFLSFFYRCFLPTVMRISAARKIKKISFVKSP